ncbi:MAG: rhomboid family intramembrane serine protease [Rhodoluna sp.]
MARLKSDQPRITISLIMINLVIWLLQVIPGSSVTTAMFYAPLLTVLEPWRMLTAGFVHSPDSFWHILINIYSIYIFGRIIEPMLGRSRFLALYLISIFGGSAAVLWLSEPVIPVVGASGAFFGLMGAYLIMLRAIGDNSGLLVGLIAVNLAFGFIVPGISWQGHLGGLLAGMAVTAVYARTRYKSGLAQKIQVLGVVGLIVLITVAGVIFRLPFGF